MFEAMLESELVPQSYLYLAWRVDRESIALKHAESGVVKSDVAVEGSENMPIEGIGDIDFEQEEVRFRDRCAFGDGEVLAEIVLTSDISDGEWQIAKQIAALGNQAVDVLIEKCGAVEVVVAGHGGKRPIGVFMTTSRLRWVK